MEDVDDSSSSEVAPSPSQPSEVSDGLVQQQETNGEVEASVAKDEGSDVEASGNEEDSDQDDYFSNHPSAINEPWYIRHPELVTAAAEEADDEGEQLDDNDFEPIVDERYKDAPFVPPSQRDDAPLSSILQNPDLEKLDPRKFFPEYTQNGILRFSRIFGSNIKSASKTKIWWPLKTFKGGSTTSRTKKNKDDKTGASNGEKGDGLEGVRSKLEDVKLDFAPPPGPEECQQSDEVLLMRPSNLKTVSKERNQDTDDEQVPSWRYGPARIWYDRMNVPANPTNFDYGFKLKRENKSRTKSTSKEEKQEEEDTKDLARCDPFPPETFLPVNLIRWEDDIVIDGEQARPQIQVPPRIAADVSQYGRRRIKSEKYNDVYAATVGSRRSLALKCERENASAIEIQLRGKQMTSNDALLSMTDRAIAQAKQVKANEEMDYESSDSEMSIEAGVEKVVGKKLSLTSALADIISPTRAQQLTNSSQLREDMAAIPSRLPGIKHLLPNRDYSYRGSAVWQHFELFRGVKEDGSDGDTVQVVRCTHSRQCNNTELMYKNASTKAMWSHLRVYHRDLLNQDQQDARPKRNKPDDKSVVEVHGLRQRESKCPVERISPGWKFVEPTSLPDVYICILCKSRIKSVGVSNIVQHIRNRHPAVLKEAAVLVSSAGLSTRRVRFPKRNKSVEEHCPSSSGSRGEDHFEEGIVSYAEPTISQFADDVINTSMHDTNPGTTSPPSIANSTSSAMPVQRIPMMVPKEEFAQRASGEAIAAIEGVRKKLAWATEQMTMATEPNEVIAFIDIVSNGLSVLEKFDFRL